MTDLSAIFSFGRSGRNLISSMNSYSGSANFRKIKRNFINERIVSYWNKLPTDFKNSESVKRFKINLEKFKVTGISGDFNLNGQFWELENKVLQRIEGSRYL